MQKTRSRKSLLDAYRFNGFKTSSVVKGRVGDKKARVLTLNRRLKKRVFVINAANYIADITIERLKLFEICLVVIEEFIFNLKSVDCCVRKLA
jgi:hypothetical protein